MEKCKSGKTSQPGDVKGGTKKEQTKKRVIHIPSISILTLEEFNEIPKYMKGSLFCTKNICYSGWLFGIIINENFLYFNEDILIVKSLTLQ